MAASVLWPARVALLAALLLGAATVAAPVARADDGCPPGSVCDQFDVSIPGSPEQVRDVPGTDRDEPPGTGRRPRRGGGGAAPSGGAAEPEPQKPFTRVMCGPRGMPCGFAQDNVDPDLLALLDELQNDAAAQQQAQQQPTVVVDPAVVARRAVANLQLDPPTIEVTAAQGPEGGAVGVPVWVWITPGASTTGPATSTAADGPVSVTATAIVQSVDWDMGDPGVSMGACGAGVPHDWASGSLERAPGECWFAGYDRSRAGTTVTISATVNWAIQWQGGGMAAGMSGQEQASTVGSVQLPIRDIRTVSTDPSGGG